MKQTLTTYLPLSAGLAFTSFVIPGRWTFIIVWGLLIGLAASTFFLGIKDDRGGKQPQPSPAEQRSSAKLFQAIGLMLALIGSFVIWKVFNTLSHSSVFNDQLWIPSNMMFLGAMTVGIAPGVALLGRHHRGSKT